MTKVQRENNGAEVRRVTWIGFFVNLFLSAGKLSVGVWGGSRALIADAVHSLSDIVTDVAVIIGSHIWNLPPDQDHPYGHRRIETIVSIGIGLLICVVGVLLAYDALIALSEKKRVHPEWIVAVMALISVIVKECLYRYTHRKALKTRSQALEANAWHHRSDAISSIPVLFAVVFSILFPRLFFLDALGAIVVSLFILKSGLNIAWPGMRQIVDTGASIKCSEKLMQAALSVPEVISIHGFRTRYTGADLYVDLHIVVNPQMPLIEAHGIAEEVERRLIGCGESVIDVLVHVDPYDINKVRKEKAQ